MFKKTQWKVMTLVAVMAVAFGIYTLAFAAEGVAQNATLTGVVVAEELAVPGQEVRRGDVLVKVRTVVGAMPAARATVDGKVTTVFVVPEQKITAGETVAEVTR